jgi:hypothetical protein
MSISNDTVPSLDGPFKFRHQPLLDAFEQFNRKVKGDNTANPPVKGLIERTGEWIQSGFTTYVDAIRQLKGDELPDVFSKYCEVLLAALRRMEMRFRDVEKQLAETPVFTESDDIETIKLAYFNNHKAVIDMLADLNIAAKILQKMLNKMGPATNPKSDLFRRRIMAQVWHGVHIREQFSEYFIALASEVNKIQEANSSARPGPGRQYTSVAGLPYNFTYGKE